MSKEIKAPPHSLEAEQGVIGALLRDNDAVDRIGDLKAEHFYSHEHAAIFSVILRQVAAGHRSDVITVMEGLRGRVQDVGAYLNTISQAMPSAVNIKRHVDIVVDRAVKRALLKVAGELGEWAQSFEAAEVIADRAAQRIEEIGQRETVSEPVLMGDLLTEHAELLEARLEGKIKRVSTGLPDLDAKLGGGMEPGTLIVVAGRPAMGKTAFGLTVARNVGEDGVGQIFSMEMPRRQIMDRNISAIGKLPLDWVQTPSENPESWDRVTHAYQRARDIRLYIDDQAGMNMLQLRAKARLVRRKAGRLDCIVIDQLSFLQGAEAENYAYALGEYTRALVALAKELDVPVLLLAQLNRKCEERPNKRPMLSDLASSGSIEQDAATVIFLYRDEVYNPDSPDVGVCEVIIAKARQGKTGMVGLSYIGEQTRFESLAPGWRSAKVAEKPRRGLAAHL